MGWFRKRRQAQESRPIDVAERLTIDADGGTAQEVASLDDAHTVQQWLRELKPNSAQSILIHRAWGTIVVSAHGDNPIGLFHSNGETTWYASTPGIADDHDLTTQQIEDVALEALKTMQRPQWPEWRVLI